MSNTSTASLVVVPSQVRPVVGAWSPAHLVHNALILGRGAGSVALAARFIGCEARALCVWCFNGLNGQPTREFTHDCARLNVADHCDECSYHGIETLAAWPKSAE